MEQPTVTNLKDLLENLETVGDERVKKAVMQIRAFFKVEIDGYARSDKAYEPVQWVYTALEVLSPCLQGIPGAETVFATLVETVNAKFEKVISVMETDAAIIVSEAEIIRGLIHGGKNLIDALSDENEKQES
jgi:hypothetical protein